MVVSLVARPGGSVVSHVRDNRMMVNSCNGNKHVGAEVAQGRSTEVEG
jgi:hypothetical protein